MVLLTKYRIQTFADLHEEQFSGFMIEGFEYECYLLDSGEMYRATKCVSSASNRLAQRVRSSNSQIVRAHRRSTPLYLKLLSLRILRFQ